MKKLLFISLLCFITITVKGQWTGPKISTVEIKLSPGDHLIKAGNNMLIGTSISLVGNLVGIISPAEGYFIGVVSGIVGSVFVIVGVVHIIKSGKTHNENDMSLNLQPTQNGLGLCMKF